MLPYIIGGLVAALAYLIFKSYRTQSEGSVSQVLDEDVKKAKTNSDKKVQEYKDAKDTFSRKYNEYITKRNGDGKSE